MENGNKESKRQGKEAPPPETEPRGEKIAPGPGEVAGQGDSAAACGDAGGAAPGVGEGPEKATISVEELKQLRKKAEERDLYRNDLLRTMADFDNYQKRVRKDRLSWESQAVDKFIARLLSVVDDFERALNAARQEGAELETLEEGVRLTHQEFLKLLADSDVLEIPAMGRPFDPHFHEAVMEEEVLDRPSGEIVGVVQKGYRRKDAVLRPSKVKVARNVAPRQPGEPTSGGKEPIGWPPSEELS